MGKALFQALRPKQWTKNLLIFAGIIFSQNLSNLHMVRNAALAFVDFCLLSGAVYLLNDIKDRETDREHPEKRLRPIASGALSVQTAMMWAVALILIGVAGGFLITVRFGICGVIYVALLTAYSVYFKHIVILDIMVLSLGYVLRAVAGIAAIYIPKVEIIITPWFIACTLFLALFIVICKRRHELLLLDDRAGNHRKVLLEYTPAFLDQMVAITTSATVISYALWTTLGRFKGYMVYTLPFVVYGVFRYLYIVYRKEEGGAPEIALLRDQSLLISIFLWLIAVIIILYL
jgi:4-hydroxybenzoate polyprenyltransferase